MASMIHLDHVALPAREPERAARFLARVLGTQVAADDSESAFFNVSLGADTTLVYVPVGEVASHHLALRVDGATFDAAVAMLHATSTVFGNDPETPDNGQITDPRGGRGRIYFSDPEGHFFELIV
ncbi:VOC family protein [Stigmatella sp. ncwal1]|uniref:VOC family protein n=1 Tax=Stigmatella ashevillensis TaxID=2995309 RepID=A0ABT5DB03_9BACT|nr:VOC family protein [Stigmatella ashevillena]MDC0710860.1 VOC family protein [Stigmatella ashevillena]